MGHYQLARARTRISLPPQGRGPTFFSPHLRVQKAAAPPRPPLCSTSPKVNKVLNPRGLLFPQRVLISVFPQTPHPTHRHSPRDASFSLFHGNRSLVLAVLRVPSRFPCRPSLSTRNPLPRCSQPSSGALGERKLTAVGSVPGRPSLGTC